MDKKNIIILIISALALSVISFFSLHKTNASFIRSEQSIGQPVFKNVNINAIKMIKIIKPDSKAIVLREKASTENKSPANISKSQWIVQNAYNYPADANKISDLLQELKDLTIIQNVPINNPDEYQELNLTAPPTTNCQPQSKIQNLPATIRDPKPEIQNFNPAAELQFFDRQKKLLYSLLVGKKRYQMDLQYKKQIPTGRYIRIPSRKNVVLTDELLNAANFKTKSWLFNPNIAINNIKSIEQLKGSKSKWILTRNTINDPIKLDDLTAPSDKANIKAIVDSLNNLQFDSVANPKSPAGQTGLNNATTLKISTFGGVGYELKIGKLQNKKYFVNIQIHPQKDKATPEDILIKQALFKKCTYMVDKNRIEPLLAAKNGLHQKGKKRSPASIYSLPIS